MWHRREVEPGQLGPAAREDDEVRNAHRDRPSRPLDEDLRRGERGKLLPRADRLYLTHIHQTFGGDTFFPKVDFASQYREVERSEGVSREDPGLRYSFVIYEKWVRG